MKSTRVAVFFAGAVMAGWLGVDSASAQEGTASRSGESQASLAPGTPVYADLRSGIDSKKAKVGDAVMAQTMEAVKSSDSRTILPRGTKLVGHVALSTARSKGDGQSALGIVFDKAILKDGEELPLSVRIQALAAPMSYSSAPDASPPQDTGNMGTTQTSPMGGRGGSGSTTPPPSGSSSGGLAGPAGNDPPLLNSNSRGVLGLHGLTLRTAAVDKALVSTVSSDGKNVHLDSGTRLLLVAQPSGTQEPAP
jgi:hypothetical protein